MARKVKQYGGAVNLQTATRDELAPIVRKMAKTANQRMIRLERSGNKFGAYTVARKNLGDRRRFREYTKNLSRADLQYEYESLLEFLNAKTSTLSGIKAVNTDRYHTAQERGFKGSYDDFMLAMQKAWTGANEALYDSETIYEAIIEDEVDILEAIVAEQPDYTQSQALDEYYRRSEARKR